MFGAFEEVLYHIDLSFFSGSPVVFAREPASDSWADDLPLHPLDRQLIPEAQMSGWISLDVLPAHDDNMPSCIYLKLMYTYGIEALSNIFQRSMRQRRDVFLCVLSVKFPYLIKIK